VDSLRQSDSDPLQKKEKKKKRKRKKETAMDRRYWAQVELTFPNFFLLLSLFAHKTLHTNVLPCTKRAGQQGADNRH